MIKVEVNGKVRIIRDKFIFYKTENDLECYYKNHHIIISSQEVGDYYVTVTDKSGIYAVQGGFGGSLGKEEYNTIEGCLVMAIENILIK